MKFFYFLAVAAMACQDDPEGRVAKEGASYGIKDCQKLVGVLGCELMVGSTAVKQLCPKSCNACEPASTKTVIYSTQPNIFAKGTVEPQPQGRVVGSAEVPWIPADVKTSNDRARQTKGPAPSFKPAQAPAILESDLDVVPSLVASSPQPKVVLPPISSGSRGAFAPATSSFPLSLPSSSTFSSVTFQSPPISNTFSSFMPSSPSSKDSISFPSSPNTFSSFFPPSTSLRDPNYAASGAAFSSSSFTSSPNTFSTSTYSFIPSSSSASSISTSSTKYPFPSLPSASGGQPRGPLAGEPTPAPAQAPAVLPSDGMWMPATFPSDSRSNPAPLFSTSKTLPASSLPLFQTQFNSQTQVSSNSQNQGTFSDQLPTFSLSTFDSPGQSSSQSFPSMFPAPIYSGRSIYNPGQFYGPSNGAFIGGARPRSSRLRNSIFIDGAQRGPYSMQNFELSYLREGEGEDSTDGLEGPTDAPAGFVRATKSDSAN